MSNRLSYGKTNLDRTHILSINALADLSKGVRLWSHAVMRTVADKWQMAAVPSFSSGRRWTANYVLTSGVDIGGSLASITCTFAHGCMLRSTIVVRPAASRIILDWVLNPAPKLGCAFRPMQANKMTILLVEDNPADVILLREALLEHPDLEHELQVVSDGEAAIRVVDAGLPCPSIVVLDLNLPRRDGHEVLSHLRRNPRWAAIPVLVVTSSSGAEDRRKAFELGATGFCTKPATLDEFLRIGDSIRAMWSGAGSQAAEG